MPVATVISSQVVPNPWAVDDICLLPIIKLPLLLTVPVMSTVPLKETSPCASKWESSTKLLECIVLTPVIAAPANTAEPSVNAAASI